MIRLKPKRATLTTSPRRKAQRCMIFSEPGAQSCPYVSTQMATKNTITSSTLSPRSRCGRIRLGQALTQSSMSCTILATFLRVTRSHPLLSPSDPDPRISYWPIHYGIASARSPEPTCRDPREDLRIYSRVCEPRNV